MLKQEIRQKKKLVTNVTPKQYEIVHSCLLLNASVHAISKGEGAIVHAINKGEGASVHAINKGVDAKKIYCFTYCYFQWSPSIVI